MARPRKRKEAAAEAATDSLISTLQFVSLAQKDIGTPQQTHLRLQNNFAVAFDGVIAIGHALDDDIHACPHTIRFLNALKECGEHFSITQLDQSRIAVKSDKFKAFVPCLEPQLLSPVIPDEPCAIINDRIRKGFEIIAGLASDNAQHVLTASVLLQSGSMIATDRHLFLEYWHGIHLPPNIVLPKAAATAITKIKKPLAKFGFSAQSATFYFDDGSWLRTQLYSEPWPDVSGILNTQVNAWPFPTEFFTALDAVTPFTEDGLVRFNPNMLCSHNAEGVGATYSLEGLPAGPAFNAKRLKLIQPYVNSIDFLGERGAYFYGENLRGALAASRR